MDDDRNYHGSNLEEGVQKMIAGTNEIDKLCEHMRAKAKPVIDTWEGQFRDEYRDRANKIDQDMDLARQTLHDVATKGVAQGAQDIAEQDRRSAAGVRG